MVFLASLVAAAVTVTKPAIPPSVFVSSNYGITFQVPRGTWICALPKDWAGSDHGTVLFLEPPTGCTGAGYPSSGRGISDTNLVPTVEIFYAHWMGEDEPREKCRRVGSIQVFNVPHALCREKIDGGIRLSITARFTADVPNKLVLSVDTTPIRLTRDLSFLHTLANTVRTCRAKWSDRKGRSFFVGSGPDCPRNSHFF